MKLALMVKVLVELVKVLVPVLVMMPMLQRQGRKMVMIHLLPLPLRRLLQLLILLCRPPRSSPTLSLLQLAMETTCQNLLAMAKITTPVARRLPAATLHREAAAALL
jgi:hypothetical protein